MSTAACVERIPIDDRASWLAMRRQDVTASAAGCLLGVHEYTTAYGLWAEKTGRIPVDAEETPAMRRGRLLEPVVAAILREDNPGWAIASPGLYLRDPGARLGATPDLFVECPQRGSGIVQVKTTSDLTFRQKWLDPDTRTVDVPLWIAVQAIIEAHLAGRRWAAVALMTVGMGLDLHLIDVPIHAGVIARIREAVAAFWHLIEEGHTPDPDYGRDARVIQQVFAEDDGGEIDLSGDNRIHELVAARAAHKAAEKAAKDALDPIEAEIKAKLGNAAIAYIGRGRSITWKTQQRKGYSVAPTSFRVLRVPSEL